MTGLDFTRNQKLALLALVGLSVMGLSVGYARKTMAPAGGVTISTLANDQSDVAASGSDPMPGASTSGQVVFHVTGCVNAPGVYKLRAGERIVNAIEAAGGATRDADLQSLNLAAKIEDGSKIHVPSLMETRSGVRTISSFTNGASVAASVSERASSSSGSEKLRNPGEGTVNINTAGIEEMQRLPGVGPATAQKIIDYRNSIGSFKNAEQLIDVKGIGPKTFEKMRPFISL